MDSLSPHEHITKLMSYEHSSYRKKWGVVSALTRIGIVSLCQYFLLAKNTDAYRKNMFRCMFMYGMTCFTTGWTIYIMGPSMVLAFGSFALIDMLK